MSQRDPLVALRHMLDHAREAAGLVQGRTRADLDGDRLLQLGLSRLVEIIGEAASRVPAEVQERHPGLPWREAIGARNVATDVPVLIPQVEQVLETESSR
jgi:uncharacterized protein with HEPN domain